jgi:hypothetical protein
VFTRTGIRSVERQTARLKRLRVERKIRKRMTTISRKYGATAVVLAKGRRIESSRDFDATRPCRVVDALE